MRSTASQISLRKNFSIYLPKVKTAAIKGHQRLNLAKYHISSEMCHYLRNYFRYVVGGNSAALELLFSYHVVRIDEKSTA